MFLFQVFALRVIGLPKEAFLQLPEKYMKAERDLL